MMQHQASPSSVSLSDDGNVSIDKTKLAKSYSSKDERQHIKLKPETGKAMESVCSTCCGLCVYGNGLRVNVFDERIGRCGCNGACNGGMTQWLVALALVFVLALHCLSLVIRYG